MKLHQIKLHRIALAVAAALAAGAAHAVLPPGPAKTAVDDANANNRVVYISGASAVKGGFTAIINSLFTGTPHWFAEGPRTNYLAAAGQLRAAAGGWPAGTNVVVIYRTAGGSIFGVNPVARNTPIASLDVRSASCGGADRGTGTPADPFICTQDSRVPDAGVADVAPALFKSPVNTEGETAAPSLTPAELATLTATPIYGLAFGIPVTGNVPAAGLLPDAQNPSAGVRFSRSIVSAILTGNVGTWNQVDSRLPAADIVICRRTPGSGTQAVMNLWAGNYPCGAANAPADRDSSAAWNPVTRTFTHTADTGGLVVVENFSSGDVRTCLDTAVSGGSYATRDRDGKPVTVNFGGGGHRAIGVLSLDSMDRSRADGHWQFRSLDDAGTITWNPDATPAPVTSGAGKFPTLLAYESGEWDLQGWISFNVPARTTGNKRALLNNFLSEARNPAILAGLPSLRHVAAGIPGPGRSGPQVLDAVYAGNNQCGPYNRNFND